MEMKQLVVPTIPALKPSSPLSDVSEALDLLPAQRIDLDPWPSGGEKVEAGFTLAHSGRHLLLKYKVREQAVLARYRNINDPVYKDTCVEFFISFGEERAYYNIEANCLGTCLVGYGPGKHDRKPLAVEAISQIEHLANLKVANHGQKERAWELTLRIPATVFTEHRLENFSGLQARGNFYKCGDDLPEPHFLVWNPVTAPAPEFHRPGDFGAISFL